MTAQELLQELGNVLGIKPQCGEAGTCRIFFDDDAVDFEAVDETFFLIAEVGSVPAGNREAVYARLLTANLFGAQTGGATLGLNEDKGIVVLHRALPLPSDYAPFEAALVRFVKSLRYWKEWLALAASAPAAPSNEGAFVPGQSLMRV